MVTSQCQMHLVHLYMPLRFKWFWHCSKDTFLSTVISFCKIKSKVTYFRYMMGRADVAVVKKEKEYKEGSCQSKTESQPGRHTLPLYVWHPGYGWMKWASYSLHHYSPDNICSCSILCKIQFKFDCNESVMSYTTATARVLIYTPNLLRKVHNILVFWGPTSIPPLMSSLQNSRAPLACVPNDCWTTSGSSTMTTSLDQLSVLMRLFITVKKILTRNNFKDQSMVELE